MNNSVEYYLAKGMDRKRAEYFAAGRRKIIAVQPEQQRRLLITFDNGERRIFDISPLIAEATVFAPLADDQLFLRVYIDEQHCISWDIDPEIDSAIVWSNKIDLCPDSCYVDSTPV